MSLPISKNKICLYFIAIFLFVEIADLHAYGHVFEDGVTIVDCEVCDYLMLDSIFPVVYADNIQVDLQIYFFDFQSKVPILYTSPIINTMYNGYNFNKPPPLQ